MLPSVPGFPFVNPMLAWTRLALKTGEMLLASSVVIHHRSNRIAAAGSNPGARDRREFMLMGQEKLEAAAESAQAMAVRMSGDSMRLGAQLVQQSMSAGTDMLALMATPAQFWTPQGQATMMRKLFANYSRLAAQMSGNAARLSSHGLRPIHTRATGNAERLVYRPARRKAGKK
jgi:hypothetical protein